MTRDQIDIGFKAWRSFLEAHAVVIPRIERLLDSATGLPFTWYDVLFQLSCAPGQRLLMHELADAVLLSRSGLTRSVDRIEAAGLVAREAIPGNRRSTHVVLTGAGKERLAQAVPIVTRGVREYFTQHLSEEEAAAVVRILGGVRDHARAGSGAEAPD
jgi:DNA-binding MarR family transcriptional regulator